MGKSYKTAIGRKQAAAPTRYLQSQKVLKGKALDYGCGKDPGVGMRFWDRYDPHFEPDGIKRDGYDTIVCNYVLNVIGPSERRDVIGRVKAS